MKYSVIFTAVFASVALAGLTPKECAKICNKSYDDCVAPAKYGGLVNTSECVQQLNTCTGGASIRTQKPATCDAGAPSLQPRFVGGPGPVQLKKCPNGSEAHVCPEPETKLAARKEKATETGMAKATGTGAAAPTGGPHGKNGTSVTNGAGIAQPAAFLLAAAVAALI